MIEPAKPHSSDELARLGAAFRLTGRTVVITGANSGIGAALTLGLAAAGMKVAAIARRGDALDAIQAAADAAGTVVSTLIADVTDEAQLESAMDEVLATFGSLHCVVANAGIAAVAPALEMPVTDFRAVMDTNVAGVFLTARCAARRMSSGGSIVLTSSNFGRRGFAQWAPYNASKAAVSMLAETLATEWVEQGIRVNAVAPGATLTPVNEHLFADEAFTASVVAGIPAASWSRTNSSCPSPSCSARPT